MNKPPSTAGVGFRFLNVGEKILDTDDVFDYYNNKWIKFFYNGDYTVNEGKGALPYGWYRRKVESVKPEIPNGWRILPKGWQIRNDDKVLENDKWVRAKDNFFPGNGIWSDGETVIRRLHVRKNKLNDPGVGYRLLKVGEKVIKGDEISHDGHPEWCSCKETIGEKAMDGWIFRRKIESKPVVIDNDIDPQPCSPGEGYRFLNPGEPIRKNIDEVCHNGFWEVMCSHGVVTNTKKGEGSWPYGWYRTKVESKPVAPEYRLLNVGEKILSTDEVGQDGNWETVGGSWPQHQLDADNVKVNERSNRWPVGYYRRKVVDPNFIDISFVATEHTIKEGNVYREIARHANDPVRLFIGHGRYPYWIGNGTIYPCSIPTILIRKMVSEGKLVLDYKDVKIYGR